MAIRTCSDSGMVICENARAGGLFCEGGKCVKHDQDPSMNGSQVGGNHYKKLAIQPWDFITSNNLGYLEGNVVKYVSRWKDKNGLQDLQKARHYLDKLIELQGVAKPAWSEQKAILCRHGNRVDPGWHCQECVTW